MKQAILVGLVCLNAALAVAVVIGAAGPARAQVVGGGGDFIMVTGHAGSDTDGVYVIDLSTRQFAALRLDKVNKQLVPFARKDLVREFGR